MVEIVKTADISTLPEAKGITSGRRGVDPTPKARDRKLKIEGAYRARLLAALRAKVGTTLTTPDLLLAASAFFDSTCHDHRVYIGRASCFSVTRGQLSIGRAQRDLLPAG
jgi:hypothetical protein